MNKIKAKKYINPYQWTLIIPRSTAIGFISG
jgi:hypothetical protein